jgi:hypothetical protein
VEVSELEMTRGSTVNLQAIVSEYAVTGNDAGKGTLVAALAEAAFLVGLEKNRLSFIYTYYFFFFVDIFYCFSY